jgi:predicted DCC family thiol-disulfide oxidoreductase YuxK
VSGTDARSGRLTVLYDARCRVCTRIAGRLAGADRHHALRLRPLQQAHADAWPSVRRLRAERDLRRELHVVDEAGDWAAGGEAMLRAIERVALFAPLARVLRWPLCRPLIEPGSRWFAFLSRSFGPAQRIGRR